MFYLDPILELMSEIDDLKITLEELSECGDLEERLEVAILVSELESKLLTLRCKEGE